MSKNNEHLADGHWAENVAVEFLKNETNYSILERNWRYKRAEIDIVCANKGRLVLVEVKYRKSSYFGEPEGAVEKAKEEKMQEAAEGYMNKNTQYSEVIFDIISISGPKNDAQLNHFKDAFFPS